MKNKFKKAFISGAIMATGLAVGYAASTAIQDLDAIRDNFDYILELNTNKQAEIDGLKTSKQEEIDGLNTTIEDLEGQIAELEQTQNNSGKQEEINKLKKQVEDLELERDDAITQRDNAVEDNSNLEAKITELLNYTNEETNKLKGEE